jgi:hypothetical protein
MTMSATKTACLALLAICLLNCTADDGGDIRDDSADEQGLEIEGYWVSNFGETEAIDANMWGEAIVVAYDNEYNSAILQNLPDAEFFPGLFSRVVWTEPESDSFYYCTVDFGKKTREEAERSEKTADSSDPERSGCGDFAWTRLTQE